MSSGSIFEDAKRITIVYDLHTTLLIQVGWICRGGVPVPRQIMKGSIEIVRDAASLSPFYARVKTQAYKQEALMGLVAQ